MDGRYSAGEPLEEEAIGVALKVSRTPVREALRRLMNDGFVEIIPRKGAVVAKLDVRDLEEIHQVRQLLEVPATKLAVGNLDLDTLGGLGRQLEELAHVEDAAAFERFAAIDLELHLLIAQATANERLASLIRTLNELVHRRRQFRRSGAERVREAITELLALVDALKAGNADDASLIMHGHLSGAQRVARGEFASDPLSGTRRAGKRHQQ